MYKIWSVSLMYSTREQCMCVISDMFIPSSLVQSRNVCLYWLFVILEVDVRVCFYCRSFRVVEDHSIMSFSVDKTDRFALINLSHQGIHLWDIRDKTLLMKFRGMSQGYFTINSCFGGVDEKFIASGSEGEQYHFSITFFVGRYVLYFYSCCRTSQLAKISNSSVIAI